MQRLRELRKAKGLSMKELGIRVGCTESAISCYELGKRSPDYETLLKLAEELDSSVSYLLEEDIKNQPIPENELNEELFKALSSLDEAEIPAVLAFVDLLKRQRKE